jgi:hypothetical protein
MADQALALLERRWWTDLVSLRRRVLQPEPVIGPPIAPGALFLGLPRDLQPGPFCCLSSADPTGICMGCSPAYRAAQPAPSTV